MLQFGRPSTYIVCIRFRILQMKMRNALSKGLASKYGCRVAEQLLILLSNDFNKILHILEHLGDRIERIKFLHRFESANKGVNGGFRLRLHHRLKCLIYQTTILCTSCFLIVLILFNFAIVPQLLKFSLNAANLLVKSELRCLKLPLERLNLYFLLLNNGAKLLSDLFVLLLLKSNPALKVIVKLTC